MDPLSALSVAAAVVQFVEFVPKLLSNANDIYRSASGLSTEHANVREVYQILTDLSLELAAAGNAAADAHAKTGLPSKELQALRKLSLNCKRDCDALLDIVQEITVSGGKHKLWRTVKAAVKGAMEKKKIAGLEGDIERTRSIMSSHVLAVLRQQILQLNDEQRKMTEESRVLGAQQSAKLDMISKGISDLNEVKSNLETPTAKSRSEATSSSQRQVEQNEIVVQQIEALKDLKLDPKSSSGIKSKKNRLGDDLEDIILETRKDDPRNAYFEDPVIIMKTELASHAGPKSVLSTQQVQDLANKLGRMIAVQEELKKEQDFLSSLCFPSLPVRHAAIPEAHRQTFTWIFESHFAEWLKSDDAGVFWLTGKAGSGKSTLMKFLADHVETSTLVQKWAEPNQAIIACHYFWSTGTDMQKSHQGLLQTLAFEILRRCPSIIPVVASPERWESQLKLPWTVAELSATLRRIGELERGTFRFCIFVDGLDEFSGDHFELCRALKDLSCCPDFKLCVSSRPWNVFDDFFGKDPLTKMAVHHKTKQDIRAFAKSRLEDHPRWREWSIAGGNKDALIDDIVERAEGVFLWAFLVTNSLRDGITNDDTLKELNERLESLPTDLERLFKHMLDGVDPLYHANMAGILRIALQATEPLRWELYYFHDLEYADSDYAVSLPLDGVADAELQMRRERTRKRINARTRGLLEMISAPAGQGGGQVQRVEFLHRTVRDFLSTGEMSDYLAAKSRPGFCVALSICRAYLGWIKSTVFYKGWEQSGRQSLQAIVRECFKYASEVPTSQVGEIDEIINELEASVVEMSKDSIPVLAYEQHLDPVALVREIARQERMDGYLQRNISRNWQYLSVADDPSLSTPPIIGGSGVQVQRIPKSVCDESGYAGERGNQGRTYLATDWVNGVLGGVVQGVRSWI